MNAMTNPPLTAAAAKARIKAELLDPPLVAKRVDVMSAANAASFAEDTRAPKEGTRPGLNPLSKAEHNGSNFSDHFAMPEGQNVNSTMLGMSNFVYRPQNQAEDTSMAEELGAFPDVDPVPLHNRLCFAFRQSIGDSPEVRL